MRIGSGGRHVWARVGFALGAACVSILVAGCVVGQSADAAGVAQPAGRGVSLFGRAFKPTELRIGQGTEVTWRNGDRVTHRLTSGQGLWQPVDMPARPPFSGRTGIGGSFAFTFDSPGTYDVYCSIHARMRSTIVVRSAGFASGVTRASSKSLGGGSGSIVPTPTPTPTRTPALTPTAQRTATPTPSTTPTATRTATRTATSTPARTATPTATRTATPTATRTATRAPRPSTTHLTIRGNLDPTTADQTAVQTSVQLVDRNGDPHVVTLAFFRDTTLSGQWFWLAGNGDAFAPTFIPIGGGPVAFDAAGNPMLAGADVETQIIFLGTSEQDNDPLLVPWTFDHLTSRPGRSTLSATAS
jgi:plastocyanin